MKQFAATCAFCGHKCLRDALDSMFPAENTQSKNIYLLGDRLIKRIWLDMGK